MITLYGSICVGMSKRLREEENEEVCYNVITQKNSIAKFKDRMKYVLAYENAGIRGLERRGSFHDTSRLLRTVIEKQIPVWAIFRSKQTSLMNSGYEELSLSCAYPDKKKNMKISPLGCKSNYSPKM